MSRNASPPIASVDPLPRLVEGRFNLLRDCTPRGNQNDHYAFERWVDQTLRRARRLDEQIVRTIATSTSGLLAQLRLLCAFHDESTNGMGRRGALLIQTIAAGIERLDTADLAVSSDPTINSVDSVYSPNQEMDGTRRFDEVREGQKSCHPLMSLSSRRGSRYH
jgi:hypothetical protein